MLLLSIFIHLFHKFYCSQQRRHFMCTLIMLIFLLDLQKHKKQSSSNTLMCLLAYYKTSALCLSPNSNCLSISLSQLTHEMEPVLTLFVCVCWCAYLTLTSRMSRWCLALNSSLFSRSLRTLASSLSSSATRVFNVLARSRLVDRSLLALSSSSCSSTARVESSWTSMEPFGSLWIKRKQGQRQESHCTACHTIVFVDFSYNREM